MPFSYEDKRLAQHRAMHQWVNNWKHAHVLKADILNTCCNLIHVDKQRKLRNSVPSKHLLQLNIFASLW